MSCHRTLTEASLTDIQINDSKQHTPSSPNPTRLWRIFFRTDRSWPISTGILSKAPFEASWAAFSPLSGWKQPELPKTLLMGRALRWLPSGAGMQSFPKFGHAQEAYSFEVYKWHCPLYFSPFAFSPTRFFGYSVPTFSFAENLVGFISWENFSRKIPRIG